jgi:hypothetical protein
MVKSKEKNPAPTIGDKLITEQPMDKSYLPVPREWHFPMPHYWYMNDVNKPESDLNYSQSHYPHIGVHVNVDINWIRDHVLYEFLHKIPDNKYYLPTDNDYRDLKPSFNRLRLNIQPYAEIMKTKFSYDKITLLIKKNNHILDFKLIQLTPGFPYDEQHVLDIARNESSIKEITIVSP